MRDPRVLDPVRLTGGGAMLLLADAAGVEYAVPVDDRLRDLVAPSTRSASSGSASGSGASGVGDGQKEFAMPSEPSRPTPLRPREIQDRVRAGESPEALAESTGNPVEKVLAFAGPVLAERGHVAYSALEASVRRSAEVPTGPSRALGEASTTRAVDAGLDPESIDWDAWRREDGRWTLAATYDLDGQAQQARFSFDHRGRFVTPLDDEARWLVGETPLTPVVEPEPVAAPEVAVELDPVVEAPRRLRLAPAPDLPETGAAFSAPGEATLSQPARQSVVEPAQEPAHESAQESVQPDGRADVPRDEEGQLDLLFDHPLPGAAEHGEDDQDREDTAGLARRHPRKQRGRASVPSWDEIMFGGRE